jgi:hypothetical protein
MKTKIKYELKVFTGKKLTHKIGKLFHNTEEVKDELDLRSHGDGILKKIKTLKLKDLNNINTTYKNGKNVLKLKTSLVEFDDSYDSSLLEAYHTALRKYCDSPASWGLWQAIHYNDTKERSIILDVFWSNLALSYRIIKKSKIERNGDDLQRVHLKEMDLDPRLKDIKNNEELNKLWYMFIGLYESLKSGDKDSLLEAIKPVQKALLKKASDYYKSET